jgi:hypothetical protein
MINFFYTYKWAKWARVFILGTPFKPSLMFVGRLCLYSPTLDKAGLAWLAWDKHASLSRQSIN